MRTQLTLALALTLAVVAAVAAGCGGAGEPSCRLYEQGSRAYLVLHAPKPAHEAGDWCTFLQQNLAVAYGHRWTVRGSPSVDYSRNVRRCRVTNRTGLVDVDIYDLPAGEPGGWLCKSQLAEDGFRRQS